MKCVVYSRYQPDEITAPLTIPRPQRTRTARTGLNAYAIENIQRILSALLYLVGALRAAPHLLAQNEKGQSGLWAFGISGDFPILLVRVRDGESLLLRETLLAFIYWRSHHVTVNLVILNDQDTGYALDLHNSIQNQIRRMGAEASLNQRDGIFVLRTDQLQTTDKILFETVAGVILDEKDGTLAEHADRLIAQHTHLPQFTASLSPKLDPEPTNSLPGDLLFDNGLGGFSHDGGNIIHLAGSTHAAPVGQRHRQSAVWISGFRIRFRLYLGREQRREPSDSLAQ